MSRPVFGHKALALLQADLEGPSEQDINEFIQNNNVDDKAAASLRNCSLEMQRQVLIRGDITRARNPSAALLRRIKDAAGLSKAAVLVNASHLDVNGRCTDDKRHETTRGDKGAEMQNTQTKRLLPQTKRRAKGRNGNIKEISTAPMPRLDDMDPDGVANAEATSDSEQTSMLPSFDPSPALPDANAFGDDMDIDGESLATSALKATLSTDLGEPKPKPAPSKRRPIADNYQTRSLSAILSAELGEPSAKAPPPNRADGRLAAGTGEMTTLFAPSASSASRAQPNRMRLKYPRQPAKAPPMNAIPSSMRLKYPRQPANPPPMNATIASPAGQTTTKDALASEDEKSILAKAVEAQKPKMRAASPMPKKLRSGRPVFTGPRRTNIQLQVAPAEDEYASGPAKRPRHAEGEIALKDQVAVKREDTEWLGAQDAVKAEDSEWLGEQDAVKTEDSEWLAAQMPVERDEPEWFSEQANDNDYPQEGWQRSASDWQENSEERPAVDSWEECDQHNAREQSDSDDPEVEFVETPQSDGDDWKDQDRHEEKSGEGISHEDAGGAQAPQSDSREEVGSNLDAEVPVAIDPYTANNGSTAEEFEAFAAPGTPVLDLQSPASQGTLLVSGLPPSWGVAQIKPMFLLFGVESVSLMRDPRVDRRVALVKLKAPDTAPKVIAQVHGTEVDAEHGGKCVLSCESFADDLAKNSARETRHTFFVDELPMPNKPSFCPRPSDVEVFVRNLPFDEYSEQEILDWCQKFGVVTDHLFLRDCRSSELTGHGYVRFCSHDDAVSFIEAQISPDNSISAVWSESERLLQGTESVYKADIHATLDEIIAAATTREPWMLSESRPSYSWAPQPVGKQLHFIVTCSDQECEGLRQSLSDAIATFHDVASKRNSTTFSNDVRPAADGTPVVAATPSFKPPAPSSAAAVSSTVADALPQQQGQPGAKPPPWRNASVDSTAACVGPAVANAQSSPATSSRSSLDLPLPFTLRSQSLRERLEEGESAVREGRRLGDEGDLDQSYRKYFDGIQILKRIGPEIQDQEGSQASSTFYKLVEGYVFEARRIKARLDSDISAASASVAPQAAPTSRGVATASAHADSQLVDRHVQHVDALLQSGHLVDLEEAYGNAIQNFMNEVKIREGAPLAPALQAGISSFWAKIEALRERLRAQIHNGASTPPGSAATIALEPSQTGVMPNGAAFSEPPLTNGMPGVAAPTIYTQQRHQPHQPHMSFIPSQPPPPAAIPPTRNVGPMVAPTIVQHAMPQYQPGFAEF